FVVIERENKKTLARADGHVADFRLGLKNASLRPRGAAVRRSPHRVSRQSLGEEEQRLVAIEPELRCVIVDVRPVPKRRGFLPLSGPTTQAARDHCEFGTALVT